MCFSIIITITMVVQLLFITILWNKINSHKEIKNKKLFNRPIIFYGYLITNFRTTLIIPIIVITMISLIFSTISSFLLWVLYQLL